MIEMFSIVKDYESALSHLTRSSKAVIDKLSMVARDSVMHAPVIVVILERHAQKVSFKVLLDIVAS
jgi:hypothetical protein